jgi:hypothetical protein
MWSQRRHSRPFREAMAVFEVPHCDVYDSRDGSPLDRAKVILTLSNQTMYISPRPPLTKRTDSLSYYVSMSMRWSRKRPRQERTQGSANHNPKDGVDLTPKTEPCPLEAPGITPRHGRHTSLRVHRRAAAHAPESEPPRETPDLAAHRPRPLGLGSSASAPESVHRWPLSGLVLPVVCEPAKNG